MAYFNSFAFDVQNIILSGLVQVRLRLSRSNVAKTTNRPFLVGTMPLFITFLTTAKFMST